MRKEIDDILEKYFPAEWDMLNITAFVGEPRFSRDVEALDKSLNQPIRDFVLRGGKRLRPLLFLALLRGFGKDPKAYLDYGFLIELVHNGTLVIDDIEDNSELRRGKPTLHKTFGLDIAINAGVAMHVFPLRVLLEDHPFVTKAQQLQLYQAYSEEIINVYAGQALDIFWHKHLPGNVTPEEYLEMARLKTGGLIRMAVRFASILAEQSSEVEAALINFAESAGIAFQVKDDVLDLTGEEKKLGKAIGGDITEGKLSLPVILAITDLDQEKQQRLLSILGQHTRSKALIGEARILIMQTSAIAQASRRAEKLIDDAWEKVEPMIPAGKGRQMFQELVDSFVKRDH